MLILSLIQKYDKSWFQFFFHFIPEREMEMYWEQYDKTANLLEFAAYVKGDYQQHIYDHVSQFIVDSLGTYKPKSVCTNCVRFERDMIVDNLTTHIHKFLKTIA